MSEPPDLEIQRGVVAPLECMQEALALLRRPGAFPALFGLSLLLVFGGGLAPFGILYAPLYCGFTLAVLDLMDGGKAEFAALGRGFELFGRAICAFLIHMLFALAVFLPLVIAILAFTFGVLLAPDEGGRVAAPGPGAIAFFVLMALLVSAVGVVMQALLLFALPLVADRRLGPWEAVVQGARGARANLGGLVALLLLQGLLAVVAALLCYLPLFLALPWIYVAQIVAYRRVFPRTGLAAVFD